MKSLLITITIVLVLALYKFWLGELFKTRPGLTGIIAGLVVLVWAVGFSFYK
jgi:hypothetical protein